MAVRSTWVTSSASSSASSPGTWLEVRAALLGQGDHVLEDVTGDWEAGVTVLGTWEQDRSLRPRKVPFPLRGPSQGFQTHKFGERWAGQGQFISS